MSDTPRKDYLIKYAPIGIRPNAAFEQAVELVDALERELNDANKTIRLQHELMTTAEKRGVDKAKEELAIANERIKRLEGDYYDLIMQVERVFDGETRHQTAKRYIKNAECIILDSHEAKEAKP